MALAYPLKGQCSYMHENGFYVIMASADEKELSTLLKNEICPHVVVPMTRSITPFGDLICLYKLVKLFTREKPEIVHRETPKAGLLGMMAAKMARVLSKAAVGLSLGKNWLEIVVDSMPKM